MEINRLKQFCAIYETENLRRAAELLAMSPGGLSKSMKQLQEELDTALFTQHGRGLAITDKGRQLYAHAKRVIHEHDLMFENMKEAPILRQALKIASFEPFTVYFMGKLAQEYFQEEKLFVLERAPGQIEQVVLSREADFGITYAPVPHPELDFLKICTFEKKIYLRKGAFAGVPIAQVPFAAPFTPVYGSPTGISSLDGWPDDVPRNLLYRLEMLEATLEFCRLGLAAIFCPEFVVSLQNRMLQPEFRLQQIQWPNGSPHLKRTVYLVKRKSEMESSRVNRLAKAIRVICATR